MSTTQEIAVVLKELGIASDSNSSYYTGLQAGKIDNGSKDIISFSPIDGSKIASVTMATEADYEAVVAQALEAYKEWRLWPAPKRGEVVRQYGQKLREHKEALGRLVTLEMGKLYQEGLGEVQEMIDICDFAVGLSRQLYGLTIASERPMHRMLEQYQPLGIVGIISAFNFPVAVWSWNAMLAAVCGDVCIWKPSEKTPITAIACHKILLDVLKENKVPEGVFNLIIGGADIGNKLSEDERVPLISATGSTRMGKSVAVKVAARLGKSLLELGGNNAIIVTPDANMDLAARAIVFGAAGTCGQRCTSTRRVIVHEEVKAELIARLSKAYSSLPIGNPLEKGILIGPLIDETASEKFEEAIAACQKEGGKLLVGGKKLTGDIFDQGAYVSPAIIEAKNSYHTVQEETFAPILYIIGYTGEVSNAIDLQNESLYGLSSAIFTDSIREAEHFLSATGSDCGIANVNIGTSGAEIGGAFGGEKQTGGGRESGSDAWKVYMRRQTNTINYSTDLPLAQGINFN
ncbi:MAG TPA: aldehyde dehydrogenase family protein [Cytophagaceae bacterium]|jgi:aldehyde dehydrogenase (NAD+)|nr:aldehyde dehydrogenase family protein [Cytophagaceae bacterium]